MAGCLMILSSNANPLAHQISNMIGPYRNALLVRPVNGLMPPIKSANLALLTAHLAPTYRQTGHSLARVASLQT
jgi:hypothetical protein